MLHADPKKWRSVKFRYAIPWCSLSRLTVNVEVCYRYVCGWDTGYGFTQLLRTRFQTIYFCINYPPEALKRFRTYLDRDVNLAYREFFLDALCADECLREWQNDIGERRNKLLEHVQIPSDDHDYMLTYLVGKNV